MMTPGAPFAWRALAAPAGLALAAALSSSPALAACELRVGYTNQEVPPYYLGAGSAEASPPGASVELIREIAASAGCSIVAVRLPPLRMWAALEAGTIDAAPLGLPPSDGSAGAIAFPLDKNGRIDRDRSMQMHTVVFIRAREMLSKDGDPIHFLQGKKIGTTHGAPYASVLRKNGYEVDEGAADTRRNFDKLLRRRIDAFAVSLASPGDMDGVVAAQYGGDIARFDKPIRIANIWLPVSRAFYVNNVERAETMWNWLGAKGSGRFAQLLKKYDKE
jgi:ABC-type amino acid transport substrate-binding protein